MIPDGYIDIVRALKVVRSRIDHNDLRVLQGHDPDSVARESLESHIRRGDLGRSSIYLVSGGVPENAPREDIDQLLLDGWDEAGRSFSSKYKGAQLLVKSYYLGSWLGPLPGQPFFKLPPEDVNEQVGGEVQKQCNDEKGRLPIIPLQPLVPLGYHTIPEVVQMLAAEDLFASLKAGRPEEAWLSAALQDGFLQVYIRGNEDIYRVPHEDVRWLSQGWCDWFADGVVPEGLGRYGRRRLLISKTDINRWLAWLLEDEVDTSIQKSGAPGRPSSMAIVLREAERRRKAGNCTDSKQAEAEVLATWLKENYPDAPPLTAKTIRNKLPFRPKAPA